MLLQVGLIGVTKEMEGVQVPQGQGTRIPSKFARFAGFGPCCCTHFASRNALELENAVSGPSISPDPTRFITSHLKNKV